MLADMLNAETIREPGFAQWVVYLLVFLIVVDRLRAWIIPPARHITGSIENRDAVEFADKALTEARLVKIEADLERRFTKLETSLDSVEQQSLAETMRLSTEGSNRVVVLSELIRSEMSCLLDKIDLRMREVYHRVNEQGESIAALKAVAKNK